MAFDPFFGGSQILPPRRATTMPSSIPASVRQVANRQGGSANEIIQSAIAQSAGTVVPLNNFTHAANEPTRQPSEAEQRGTIALVDDAAGAEVNAISNVVPFDEFARRRLMGAPVTPTNPIQPSYEDSMPLVATELGIPDLNAAPEEKKSNLGWWVAGAAILAVLWKFSQDSALQGAPLVAELDVEDDEPEGSEEE